MPAATPLTRRFVPTDFDPADWAQSQPLIDDLTQRTLTTVGEAQQWLADYGELTAVLREHGALTNIAKACDTESEQVDRAFLHWVEDIDPKLAAARDRLGRKLLDSGLADELPADEFATMVRDWRAGVELFRAENVPLQTKLTKLASDYDKHLGGLTVAFRGETRALPQLAKFQEDPDRTTREEAWRLDAEQRLTVREKIDGIYSEQVALRDTMAKNAGLPDYTEWQWRDSRRFDYTRDDCTRFCDAIAEVCVPRVRALNEKRKAALGVETLRPWDASADPHGRAPLTPFASDNAQGLVDGCHAIFEAIDPSLAEDFSRLKMGRNLDLVARKGKRGGGFQSSLTERREPFIFMNAAGRQIDVRVMLHEAGHAFHYMWGSATQPSYFNQGSPIEFAEVASMTMELFGLDHYGEFYPGDEAAARRAKHELLEGIVRFFPWMAAIDRFQHWVYANPTHTPDERTAAWLDLVNTYGTRHGGAGVDWAGLDDELASYWQRQIHLPHYPFYYVEYGIAQLGALQLWQQYRSDPGKALANYRSALSLGKRRTLPGLFEAAGIRFDFSRDTLEPLIRDVAEAMDALADDA